ncbi:MAG: ABC transporter ATP-binding protein, partial [Chloroflexi bacterium]|nr:ABC transporter ATP-binding protein [Chloroflexota bacterium]
MTREILQVKDLEVKYHTREGILTAISNASFDIQPGEIVGVVGESGCGKSTLASAMMRLLPPNGQISKGQILFQGQDLLQLSDEEMRRLRGRDIAMVFQDAMTSLNPVFSIEQQMIDAQKAQMPGQGHKWQGVLRDRAMKMLERVGIPDVARQIKQYPHQFSGGMRQRIMIAIALLSNPALLVADEPTSALDVTLEAQILDLIVGLRQEFGTAILYITHDLGVIARLCDRVIVMYAGRIVEYCDVFSIFDAPKHPYTQALLRSHPSYSMREQRLRTIRGRVPDLRNLPSGCKFAPRCDLARELCHTTEPAYLQVDGHYVLCHAYDPTWDKAAPALATPAQSRKPAAIKTAKTNTDDEVIVKTVEVRTYFRDHVAFLGQILGLGQESGAVRAVDGVDIAVHRGETLG